MKQGPARATFSPTLWFHSLSYMAGREIRIAVSVLTQTWNKNGNMCVYKNKMKRAREEEKVSLPM